MPAVGPLTLRNPVVLASGVMGDSPEKLRNAYHSGAGAVVTKSITREPREGNPEPTIFKLDSGWTLNRVGLRNPGAEAFADTLGTPDYPVIVSLAGSIPSDFAEMVCMFDGVIGFELNVSCPNVDGMGDRIGNDPTLTAQVVTAVKVSTDLPIFVKIGPQMYHTAGAAIDAGADGITAINTMPGMYTDTQADVPVARRGGLSGPHLLPIGLKVVRDLVREYNVPVMGCGGISTWEDAADYLSVGAFAVQIGTAAMQNPSILGGIASMLGAPKLRYGLIPGTSLYQHMGVTRATNEHPSGMYRV